MHIALRVIDMKSHDINVPPVNKVASQATHSTAAKVQKTKFNSNQFALCPRNQLPVVPRHHSSTEKWTTCKQQEARSENSTAHMYISGCKQHRGLCCKIKVGNAHKQQEGRREKQDMQSKF
jgi:hypothetical protein